MAHQFPATDRFDPGGKLFKCKVAMSERFNGLLDKLVHSQRSIVLVVDFNGTHFIMQRGDVIYLFHLVLSFQCYECAQHS